MPACQYLGKLCSILCLTGLSVAGSQAQQIIDHPKGIKVSFYDAESDRLVRIFADRYEVLSPAGWEKSVRYRSGLDGNTSVTDSYLIGDRLWMVYHPDNQVWRESGDSVKPSRVWTMRKMQIESLRIRRGNEILSHGGYGLWSARHLLLRFDTSSMKWTPWPVKKGNGGPPGLFQHYGHIQDNRLWMFAGTAISDRDPFDFPDNKEVWSFDFADSVWRMNGLINPKLYHRKHMMPHRIETLTYGDKLIVYHVEDKLAVMDFAGNSVRFHRLTTHNKKSDFASQLNTFFRGGKFYYYRFNKPLNDTINVPAPDFLEIPENLFLGDLISEEPIYGTAAGWWMRDMWKSNLTRGAGIGIMLLTGMVFLLRWLRKKATTGKQIFKLKADGLYMGKRLILTGGSECGILRKFSDGNTEISLGELLDGFDEIRESARATVNRINLQIRSAGDIDFDLIEYIRLSSDQRMSGFRITQRAEIIQD